MMLKDFFEIEHKQKNTLLIFIGLTLISFLQLFIFKKKIFEGNFLILIGLSLSIALCWTILNIIPLFIILSVTLKKSKLVYENVIPGFGTAIIGLQVVLTYIAYKKENNFEELIDFVWISTLSLYLMIFISIKISERLETSHKN
ncbi:hypothetical protein ACLI1A_04060 [Flavobacterium sp. RHBU_3]|uniref:hypothetical protein n=1 Tax=Flavobacterium sp. RHBU_3 TaxID=3391184 RepID=UPI003985371F